MGAAPSRVLHSRRSSRLVLSAAAQGSQLRSGPRKNSYEATPFAYGHTHPPRNSENPELCRKVDSPDAGARLSYLCMKQTEHCRNAFRLFALGGRRHGPLCATSPF